jgi:PAS domain S-box-containing protein
MLLVFLVAMVPLGWLVHRLYSEAKRVDWVRIDELAQASYKALMSARTKHHVMLKSWVARLQKSDSGSAAKPFFDALEKSELGRFRAVGYAEWTPDRHLEVRYVRAPNTAEAVPLGTDLANFAAVNTMLGLESKGVLVTPPSNEPSPLPGVGERVIAVMGISFASAERGVIFATTLPDDFLAPTRNTIFKITPEGKHGAEIVLEEHLPGVGEGVMHIDSVSPSAWDAAHHEQPAPRMIRMGGTLFGDLNLVFRPGPNFGRDSLVSESWLVLGIGSVVAALFAMLAWMQARQGDVLRSEVARQTEQLKAMNDELIRFKIIVESTSDLVGIVSMDVETQYVNLAGRTMLGVGANEPAVTMTTQRIFAPEAAARIFNEGIPHAMVHGTWTAELDMLHSDGRRVPVSFVGIVMRDTDGHPFNMASVARDMTAQRQSEQRLRATNDELSLFKAIAETTSDFIGVCDLNHQVTYINQAGRALVGIAREAPDESFSLARIFSAESLSVAITGIEYAMSTGPWTQELNFQNDLGADIPVWFVGFVIRSPDGQPVFLAGIARDIRERHQLDTQLRESLEQQRELVQLKSQFVNTVSHEFRTPLGVILSSADILTHYLERLAPDARQQHLHDIHRASIQMARMLDQVLDLGRIEAGKLGCNPCPLDLSALLQRITDESHSASNGCRIELHLLNELSGACADESLLRHIFFNLLSNARKYSAADSCVEFNVQREGNDAVFTVRDHGIGIPASAMPHLFEAFSRAANVGDTPGTGLGLAIVKRCTDLHTGTVSVESAEDHGTLVTVRLPLFLI